MKIETNKGQPAIFYIARVGLVGKPLKTPYTLNNSFAVTEADHLDYDLVSIAYEKGLFKYYERGTCQQYITLEDTVTVLDKAKRLFTIEHVKRQAIINDRIELLKKELKLLGELKRAIN